MNSYNSSNLCRCNIFYIALKFMHNDTRNMCGI